MREGFSFALRDRLMIFRLTFMDGSRCGAGWLCGQVVPPPLSCTVQPPFGGKASRSLEYSGMMIIEGNHPQIALFQIGDLSEFKQIL